ncbi:MAG: lipid II flippase MurJ, partial [Rhodanobacter sp.]
VWPRWGWGQPQVRRILRLMVPTLFGSSVMQVNLLLDTVILSLLVTGSQSWFSLSTRFLELPLGVFGVALGTVILPSLSRHHVSTDRLGFSRALDWGLRVTWLIALPAMLALLLLAGPIVATLFQHGRFSAFDTHMSTMSILALCCGLPAYALVKVLLPAFYARQDTKTPVRAGVLSMIASMILNGVFIVLLFTWWAPPALQQQGWLAGIAQVPGLHLGLAIASALSSYVNFLLLWHWLKKAGVYQRQPGWGRHWVRLLLACAVMVVVLVAGRWWWPHWSGVPIFTRVWHLAVLVGAGGLSYIATLFASGLRLRDLRGG